MPLSLAFRFLAGRYHATPFGHHVNEGLIEWPPSPWRLLRALISVGYTSGAWDGVGPPPTAHRLFENLSSELPHYSLPPAASAHSRHYMPVGSLESKTKVEKTALVFDTWAKIEDQELIVIWPNVLLEDAGLSMLRLLVERLNYLGRSESWIEGRVMGDGEPLPEINCLPEQAGQRPDHGFEHIALLAPESAPDFEDWRTARLEEALIDLPLPVGRKPTKALLSKRAKAEQPYPADLLDCLHKDTTWLRSHGWNQPPGSRRVLYWRPTNAISVGAAKTRTSARPEQRVEAMLLSLTNVNRNDRALPPVTRTLPQAELLHRALVGIAARNGTPPSELTGRDINRLPLSGPHQHAHINPLDLDDDGHLDHILVWAPGSLGPDAQAAVRTVRKTFAKGEPKPLRLALSTSGDLSDLARLPGVYGRRVAGITCSASTWQSVTPFVPPRYLKAKGKNALEGQIRAELGARRFPDPTSITLLSPLIRRRNDAVPEGESDAERIAAHWNRFRHFKLVRQNGPEPPIICGFAIQLEFESSVTGPIALGYGSHFGLGLFGHSAY